LIDFIYLYELEQRNLLQLLVSEAGMGLRAEMVEMIKTMYNISLFGILTMNPPFTTNIS
jgi:hypothetical protein